jgi:hypothetical protein
MGHAGTHYANNITGTPRIRYHMRWMRRLTDNELLQSHRTADAILNSQWAYNRTCRRKKDEAPHLAQLDDRLDGSDLNASDVTQIKPSNRHTASWPHA